jgi:alpha-methylacyl-CoA racemase
MERLGLGPDICMARNARLVYGRMTGWGQDGPLANTAGHDIDYIALAGALHGIGEAGRGPVPPLNQVGDFGGGGAYLCIGVLAALLEARGSGKGQVVDAAIVDGAASLMAQFYGRIAHGDWIERRGANAFDSGSHFYNVYETADGEHVAIGAVEARFYRRLLAVLDLQDDPDFRDRQMDRRAWPELKARLATIFRGRTRQQWCDAMAGHDVCFAPVLRLGEAVEHPHAQSRCSYVELDGIVQPAPAPRFSRTVSAISSGPPRNGQDTEAVLAELGYAPDRVAALRAAGAIG